MFFKDVRKMVPIADIMERYLQIIRLNFPSEVLL